MGDALHPDTIVTAMSGLPSIVAGLFIYSTYHRDALVRLLRLRSSAGPVRDALAVGHEDD